ncbi:MAG: GNAT family N-acetyltransferase [Planctomycetota bacterium]
MDVETLDARRVSQEDAVAIGQLLAATWPNPEKPAEYRAQQLLSVKDAFSAADSLAPRSFIVREHERVIAHAAIVPRKIGTANGEMTIAGLAQVCTALSARGRGLGEKVVRAAFSLVDASEFPHALFQTSSEVRPFYEKLGACRAKNRVINSLADDPDVSPFWDRVVMRYPMHRPWPEGDIDLRGPGY